MKKIVTFLFPLTLLSCSTSDKNNSDSFSDTVAIFFHDNSLNKENPSLIVTVDDKIIFQSDSIEKSQRQDFEIPLTNGKHIVKAQTADKQIQTIDTINVEKENIRYLMSVNYEYNPPKDWWKKYVISETYKKTLAKNKLPADTIIKWLTDSLTRQVEGENKISAYKPTERHFKIEFYKQPLLE